jgi:hypothetical protein
VTTGSGSRSRFRRFWWMVSSSAGAGASCMSASGTGDLTSPFAWRFFVCLGLGLDLGAVAFAVCGLSSKTSNSSSMVAGHAGGCQEYCAVYVS